MSTTNETPKVKLIVYGHLLSQPVRAVLSFCKHNNIPYEFKIINIQRGENR